MLFVANHINWEQPDQFVSLFFFMFVIVRIRIFIERKKIAVGYQVIILIVEIMSGC